MIEKAGVTVLLICDVWDNHYCADLRRRMQPLAERIDEFAELIRGRNGRVLHCPSETVDDYYSSWPQREVMRNYPKAEVQLSEDMRPINLPLETGLTSGCPDIPLCRRHSEFTKQHEAIKILPEDLISDSGQEIYNFIVYEAVVRILVAGTALNMCVLGRPFGVVSLVELGLNVCVVSDLVEVFYAPVEPPYITIEQARWFALGYIQARWCPVTTLALEKANADRE